MRPAILGLDPGFASCGYAVLVLALAGACDDEVLLAGVLRTEKSSKKRDVRAAEDNVRRAREIATSLQGIIERLRGSNEHRIVAIAAEAYSPVRNSGAAAKVGITWGVIATIAVAHGDLPIVQATPMELKRRVAGNGTASKDAVATALRRRYGEGALDGLLRGTPPSMHEHAYDALGAIAACLDAEVIRLARRMSAQGAP